MLKRMKSQKRQNWIANLRSREMGLPAIPVLPRTILLLEMEMQERCVDLRGFSQHVLSDVGATIQVLRMAAREYGCSVAIARIEDYIADLGIHACFETLSMHVATYDARYSLVADFWAHCKDVAEKSRHAADQLDLNPDHFYLAGLFHSLQTLPEVLGWDNHEECLSDGNVGMIARLSLPHFVCDLVLELQVVDFALPRSVARLLAQAWDSQSFEEYEGAEQSLGLCEAPKPLVHSFVPHVPVFQSVQL